MIGLSGSTIYNLENAGTFPKKIHVSQHCVRYKVGDVRECKVGDVREWMKSLEDG
jgi:predicted DNA-binding transcriptional regulator AlpA